jgi:hypothetical protein
LLSDFPSSGEEDICKDTTLIDAVDGTWKSKRFLCDVTPYGRVLR